jgi:hypothetical protein
MKIAATTYGFTIVTGISKVTTLPLFTFRSRTPQID